LADKEWVPINQVHNLELFLNQENASPIVEKKSRRKMFIPLPESPQQVSPRLYSFSPLPNTN
jgi:hypothetical protein